MATRGLHSALLQRACFSVPRARAEPLPCQTLTSSDRLCAQDEKILSSPVKVKKFLEQQGIQYDPATPESVLKGKCKARMKRIAEEGISTDAKRAAFETVGGSSLSVEELLEILERVKANKTSYNKHYHAEFVITDLNSTTFTVKKHEIGSSARRRRARCTATASSSTASAPSATSTLTASISILSRQTSRT